MIIESSTEANVSLQLNHPIRYRLTVKDLNAVEVAGAGTVRVTGIRGEDLKATLSGGGLMDLAGYTGQQEVRIDGNGIYKAADLESRNATLDVEGGGELTVWVTERLDVKCRGACSVKYYGNPELGKNIDAVGVITSLGEK